MAALATHDRKLIRRCAGHFIVAAALVVSASVPGASLHGQTGTIVVGDNVLVSAAESETPHLEPHLAVDPGDPMHLVVASMQFPSRADQTVSSFASFDGGQSWSESRLPGCRADPWVRFDRRGSVYVSCLTHHELPGGGTRAIVDVRRSNAGGLSWSEPVGVPIGTGRSSDRPMLLLAGEPTRGEATIYIVRGQAFQHEGRYLFGPSIARSTDRAASFSAPDIHALNTLDNLLIDAAVLSSGALAIVTHDFQQGGRHPTRTRSWLLVSDDGGRTMGPARFILDTDVGRLAVDRSRADRLYVVVEGNNSLSEPTYGPERSDTSYVYLLSSDDRGMEWSVPIRV